MNMNAERSNSHRPEPFVERHLQVHRGTLHVAPMQPTQQQREAALEKVFTASGQMTAAVIGFIHS